MRLYLGASNTKRSDDDETRKIKKRGEPRAFLCLEFVQKRGFSTASTFEFTGLRGFSRRSGGMMG